MSQRPDLLIVPIRDRRQGRRILTLRNVGLAALTLFVLFIAITLFSERGRGPSAGDYGRLNRELPPTPQASAPVEVVNEATPVNDHVSADPMLSAPAARSQWLEGEQTTAQVVPIAPPVTLTAPRGGNADVAIVGGPGGVATVQQKPRPEKQLKGGIFRQP